MEIDFEHMKCVELFVNLSKVCKIDKVWFTNQIDCQHVNQMTIFQLSSVVTWGQNVRV